MMVGNNGVSNGALSYAHTGWLKKKCPTGKNIIFLQPVEIFLSKFQVLLWTEFAYNLSNYDVIRPQVTSTNSRLQTNKK